MPALATAGPIAERSGDDAAAPIPRVHAARRAAARPGAGRGRGPTPPSATPTAAATAEPGPARTRIGAFVTSLSDIQESQRRFDITLWVWLLSPASIGTVDPARTLEITNAALVERQYAVTTDTAAGRYSQVKFRASVRAPLDFTHFPFDRHVLQVQLEDAERDLRSALFVPDTPPGGRHPALTNLAEKRLTPAHATRLSQRLGIAWLAALIAMEAALVLSHSA